MAEVLGEMTMFVVFTVVIGALIFGGVTLTYLWDARSSRSTPEPARPAHEESRTPAAADDSRAAHDRAA